MDRHDSLDKKGTSALLQTLQIAIAYEFTQVKFLEQAMIHSSVVNEQLQNVEHNERLEFLGDAVLELCISQALYTLFPHAREGQLTAMRSQLVNQDTLACLARQLRLDECLILGKGEESQGGRTRDALLADAFEALLGALFLDSDFKTVQKTVERLFAPIWPKKLIPAKAKDAKSLLQELTQRHFKGLPSYRTLSSSGPEHAKLYSVQVDLPDKSHHTATGSSVKRAEQAAAQAAIDAMQQKGLI